MFGHKEGPQTFTTTRWTYGTERVITPHLLYLLVRKDATAMAPTVRDGKKP